MEIGKTRTASFVLMPPVPGTCPECAVNHTQDMPHNRDSLYYQYSFWTKHKRWPTWGDAMAHCPENVKAIWRDELMKRGISANQLEVPVADGGVDQQE